MVCTIVYKNMEWIWSLTNWVCTSMAHLDYWSSESIIFYSLNVGFHLVINGLDYETNGLDTTPYWLVPFVGCSIIRAVGLMGQAGWWCLLKVSINREIKVVPTNPSVVSTLCGWLIYLVLPILSDCQHHESWPHIPLLNGVDSNLVRKMR